MKISIFLLLILGANFSLVQSSGQSVFSILSDIGSKASPAFAVGKGLFTIMSSFKQKRRHAELMNGIKRNYAAIQAVGDKVTKLGDHVSYEHKRTRLFNPLEKLRTVISFAKLRGYNEANIKQRILEVANEGQWLHTIGTIYRNFEDYMDSVFDSDEVRRHPTKMERVLNDYFNLISTAMAMIQRAVTTDLKSHANFKDLVFRLNRDFKRLGESGGSGKFHREHMKIKVKEVLRKNNDRSSNRDVLNEIRSVLKNSDEKFYWLDFGVLVYNDIYGYGNHHVWGGYRVDVFHEYGRNVIVFYRYKNQSPAGYISGSVRSKFLECGYGCATYGCGGGCSIGTPSKSAYDAFVKIKRYNGLWFNFDSSFHEKYENEETWTLMLLPKDN